MGGRAAAPQTTGPDRTAERCANDGADAASPEPRTPPTAAIRWKSASRLKATKGLCLHRSAVTSARLAADGLVVSVSSDTFLKIYSLADDRQMRSASLSNLGLSSCVYSPADRTVIVGSLDNFM